MYQKSRRFQTKIITYAVLVIFSLLVIGVFVYSYVSKYQENKLDIKSRYTFSIRIDDQWNVVSDDYVSDYDNDNVSNFTNPDMVGLGTKWLEKYISQYRQKYVPYSKYIVKSGVDSVSVLDLSSNTVLLSFWVIPQNLNSDYFSSWEGIQDDGRIKCEWVVSFYLDNNYDNTAKLYVTSVMSSEDYGLKQYYAQQGIDSGGDTEITSNSNKDQLANYSIKDNSLLVTYDREKYISVPNIINKAVACINYCVHFKFPFCYANHNVSFQTICYPDSFKCLKHNDNNYNRHSKKDYKLTVRQNYIFNKIPCKCVL